MRGAAEADCYGSVYLSAWGAGNWFTGCDWSAEYCDSDYVTELEGVYGSCVLILCSEAGVFTVNA